MSTILERNGDSRWYIKHTDAAENPDIASTMIKLAMDLNEDVGNDGEELAACLC